MSEAASAFGHFMNEHAGIVRRMCRAILQDDHLADDAAQDAFVRLWRQWRDRGRPESAEGWIRRAAIRTSLDAWRRRDARDRTTHAVLEEARESDVAVTQTPVTEAVDHELRARYEAALEALPEGQRTIFVLRHEAGLPLAAIAESLSVAVPTVRTQFARACVRLQTRLAPYRIHSDSNDKPEDDR